MVLSYPTPGKHLVFDGRFLHAAPTLLNEGVATAAAAAIAATAEGKDGKEGKEDVAGDGGSAGSVRVTFLVNIWLNHQPVGIAPFPTEYMLPQESILTFPLPAHTVAATPGGGGGVAQSDSAGFLAQEARAIIKVDAAWLKDTTNIDDDDYDGGGGGGGGCSSGGGGGGSEKASRRNVAFGIQYEEEGCVLTIPCMPTGTRGSVEGATVEFKFIGRAMQAALRSAKQHYEEGQQQQQQQQQEPQLKKRKVVADESSQPAARG